jgi:hypothetical protein
LAEVAELLMYARREILNYKPPLVRSAMNQPHGSRLRRHPRFRQWAVIGFVVAAFDVIAATEILLAGNVIKAVLVACCLAVVVLVLWVFSRVRYSVSDSGRWSRATRFR